MLYSDYLKYLAQPMPDISGIFTTSAAQPFIQPQPDGAEQIQEQIDQLEQYPVGYIPYTQTYDGGGGGNDDTGNIDTTNNAGITGLPGLLTAAGFVLNPIGTILGYGAKKAYDNIRNPYTNVFGNLNKETEEAIAREQQRDIEDRIAKGEVDFTGGITPEQDKYRGGQFFDDVDTTPDILDDFEVSGKIGTQGPGGFFDVGPSPSSSKTQAQATANRDAARVGGGGATSGPSGTMSDAQAEANRDAARGGQSGGGGGGGKIVCTMMNESYGFGSFRNKIWLKHSKDLAPEYQKGYHKIFLPLVKYSKQDGVTNKIVKKILEHIAVHRTIDIRQESRGKIHLLGRIYRKVLEPLCYLVGKHG